MSTAMMAALVAILLLVLVALVVLILRSRGAGDAGLQQEIAALRTQERDDRQAASAAAATQAGELAQQRTLREAAQAQLAELRERHEALQHSEAASRADIAQLKVEVGALQKQHEHDQQRLVEQKTWIETQTAAFETRIKALTAELLKAQSEEAQKQSRQNLDQILAPFRTSLGDFRQQVESFAKDQAREREGLVSSIKTLAGVHSRLSSQTEALSKALTTQNKQSGDWGEIQLIRYLESAGFEEGVHYRQQVTVQAADQPDAVQRPDVILYLPENRQVVIDSKVSIKAWTQSHQVDDEAERAGFIRAHVESMRRHISELGAKDYAASPDISSLDFVVMFVPVEGAYVAAASQDPHLFQDAFRKNVIVASPTLLLAILKLVTSLWNIHKQEENAAQVIELAGKIHHKLAIFAKSYEDVGARLESAQRAFDAGRGQLAEGPGNAIKLLLEMEKHGIKLKKSLPDSMRQSLVGESAADEKGDSVDDD